MSKRRPRRVLVISVIVVALFAVVGIVAATRPSIQATEVGSPLLGKAAPSFAGLSLATKPVGLSTFAGHYVYVNFFASWCPPCSEEEPSLIAWDTQQSRLHSGAKLLSVVFNDVKSAATTFSEKWGTTWPIIMDRGGQIANTYGVASPPMTFLINPKGVIAGVWVGPVTVTQLNTMLVTAEDNGT